MPNNTQLSTDLFLKLKGRFPELTLGDSDGMTTVDPKKAVFFDFDFTVNDQKIASVSISIADQDNLQIIVTKDVLNTDSDLAKKKWFDFQREMRNFAKQNLLSFEPSDITKSRLDKKDYQEIVATTKDNKDQTMSESSLYGSTRSSYQTLENTKLIIRHSKKIDEESANSRTRNIDALYIESAGGERFRYPFIHLSGARAMQRHIANEGNPYDSFGQYIVSLSEQAYNLRKFNGLISRKHFLENAEIAPIAQAARVKAQSVKKTLESIQKQSGYVKIKENFKGFERKELDPTTLESLRSKFTIQQFNEELVELFPYITDLLESDSYVNEISQDAAVDLIDRARKMFPDKSHPVHKSIAGLIQAINVGSNADPYATEIKNHIDSMHEGGSGDKPEHPDMDQDDKRWDDMDEAGMPSSVIKNKQKMAEYTPEQLLASFTNVAERFGGATPAMLEKLAREMAWRHGYGKMSDHYWKQFKHLVDGAIDEARPFVKGSDPKTSDYGDADAAEEPWDDKRTPVDDLAATIESLPQIQIEKFDVASIQNAMDATQNQIKDLTKAVQDNPKDKKTQYGLEKAQARLGLLQARLSSANPQTTNIATRNAMLIDHLSKHVKDDRLSLQLARISDEYHSLSKPEMKRINDLIRAMMSKAKVVDMFTSESTTFEELESMLSTEDADTNKNNTKINHLEEFEKFLNNPMREESNILSSDTDVKEQALKKLKTLMSSDFPAGTNGINAIESLEGIIDDPELVSELEELGKDDSNADAKSIVMNWLENNAPEVANTINSKDQSSNDDAKGTEEMDPEMGQQNEQVSMQEVAEYVKSLYDSNVGKFPKGETGVLESVKKKFGDSAVAPASQIIEALKHKFDENLMRLRKLAGVS